MPGAHVKIESRPFPVTYTVTGARDTFDFSGPFWAPADIIVLVNGVALLPADFTVVGNFIQDGDTIVGAFGGGTVILNTAVSSSTVVIDRLIVDTRESDYGATGPLPPNALNSDLDKLTARDQDIIARLGAGVGLGLSAANVRDIVAAFLAAGANVTLTRVGDTLTVAASGGGGGSDTDAWTDIGSIPATIVALAALTPAADRLAYFNGTSTAALTTLTAFARTLLAGADAATMRTALGLGSAALLSSAGVLQPSNNLSDVSAVATARTNLGLGSAALLAAAAVLQAANNLSDLANAGTARTNLGLGVVATKADLSTLLAAGSGISLSLSGGVVTITNTGSGSSTSTWNPADVGTHTVLSGGNLIATNTNPSASSSDEGGRNTLSKSSGKAYFEYKTIVGDVFAVVGLTTGTMNLNTGSSTSLPGDGPSGDRLQGFSIFVNGEIIASNAIAIASISGMAAGNGAQTIQVAVDLTAKKVWVKPTGGSLWNGTVGDDPATGVGGVTYTNAGPSALFIAYVTVNGSGTGAPDGVILNTGGASFIGTVPSGFSAWG